MSKILHRNLCYLGIARYIGELFEHSNKIVLQQIALSLIGNTDKAIAVFIKSTKPKINVVKLGKIERKLNQFIAKLNDYEFHIIELIGLALALIEDMFIEIQRTQDQNRIKAVEQVIESLFVLNKYFDRKFERGEKYDKAIELTKLMEDIWNE